MIKIKLSFRSAGLELFSLGANRKINTNFVCILLSMGAEIAFPGTPRSHDVRPQDMA
jgi:hypothetical protein